jgi:hypothetical protein
LENHEGFNKTLKPLKGQKLKSLLQSVARFVESEFLNRDVSMKKETQSWLISHYMEHNRRLENLTGRDLSCWDIN